MPTFSASTTVSSTSSLSDMFMGDDGLFAKYGEGWREFGLHHWRPGELGGSVVGKNETGDGGGDGNISMIFSSSSDMIMGDDGLLAKYGEGGREFVLRR